MSRRTSEESRIYHKTKKGYFPYFSAEKVVEIDPAAYDIMAAGCEKDDMVLSEKEKTRTCNPPNVPMFSFNTIKKGESFLHLIPNGNKQSNEVISNEEKVAIPDSQPLPGQGKEFPCRYCPKSFKSKGGRSNHENSHARQKVKEAPTVQSTAVANVTSQIANQQIRVWGDHTADDIQQIISAAYEEIVYWRPNMFHVPSGAIGKEYIKEITRLIDAWNNNNKHLKPISLKAVMIMPYLLLQKPCYKSSAKQNSECLKRRMALWTQGDFDSILREARTIQSILKKNMKANTESKAKRFAKFILAGNVKAALRLLDDESSKGVLNLTNSTLQELLQKHPKGEEPDESALLTGDVPFCDPVVFESIDESRIAASAMKTKGAAGPS